MIMTLLKLDMLNRVVFDILFKNVYFSMVWRWNGMHRVRAHQHIDILFLNLRNRHLFTNTWMNCMSLVSRLSSSVLFLSSSTMFVVSFLCFRWSTFENDDYPVYSCSFCQFFSVRQIFQIYLVTCIFCAFRLVHVFRFFNMNSSVLEGLDLTWILSLWILRFIA